MSETKLWVHGILDALNKIPREQWTTHPVIYKEMVECRRLNGIIRNHILKSGVDVQCINDISAEVYAILQMKMLKVLDNASSFYSVAYRVSELVVSSYRKKHYNLINSKDVSLDATFDDNESDSTRHDILSYEVTMADFSEDVIHTVDLHNAKLQFSKKLATLGWPEDIPKLHKRIGRPRK